jgi:uncharacterized repeat protein (TIGR03803 family)
MSDPSKISHEVRWVTAAVVLLAGVMIAPIITRSQTASKPGVAAVYSVLYSFTGGTDGANPKGSLIHADSQTLYGTANYGGAIDVCGYFAPGCGVVFKLTTGGAETVLYSFVGGTDGADPISRLIRDSSGNLYGGTFNGGGSPLCGGGCGTVFKLSPTGTETVLNRFGGTQGQNVAWGNPISDAAGNIYATTPGGGAYGGGVVFKLSRAGKETVLYNFTGGTDGSGPFAGPIADSTGNLYGAAVAGGAFGYGVVYKLSSTGELTVLYNFTNGSDGASPIGGLVRDSSGNLYGTAQSGGASGDGVVFELSPGGTETVLHSFSGPDGSDPFAALIRDSSGNLYGTTQYGGASNACAGGCGVVFELSPAGKETVLHSFSGADGANPLAGVMKAPSGDLYGTAYNGGTYGYGVVFQLRLNQGSR